MTLHEASSHSVPQLRLLKQAAHRMRSDAALCSLQTHYAANAATTCKEGRSVYEKLRDAFIRALKE